MSTRISRLLLTTNFLITTIVFSQKLSIEDRRIIDSLKKLDYKEIYTSFKKVENDSIKAFVFAQAYLEKGKEEKDSIKIANAYSQLNFITNNPYVSIRLGDSIIHYTKNLKHKDYPSLGYLIKAGEYYFLGKYKLALDNYIITYKYLEENENVQYRLAVKTEIAGLKNILGLYEEAFFEFKDILKLVINDSLNEYYNDNYLTTLLNLTSLYNSLDKLDSAGILIKEGIHKSLALKDTSKYYEFITAGGFNEYFKGNYQAAIDSLDKAFPYDNDQNARINYYLYKGKIAKNLGKPEEAITHFKKLDSIYEIHQDPVRELPEVYKTFVDYYKEKNDIKNQLKYLDKLISADSILDANFRFLNKNIQKHYDIPQLLSEKEHLILKLKTEKKQSDIGLIILGSSIILLGSFLFYYVKRQKSYKKRFKEVFNDEPDRKYEKTKASPEIKGVSLELITEIRNGLLEFEDKKGFLNSKTTLNSLSKKLDTNTNYLSKIINFYEQKNFSNYLNDLRIEYAIKQLKTDPQFQLYSIKGIAQEVGFNSGESFSKAFYKRTGIYPSYFLKQLKKIKTPL
ncbi:helix-turn-helix domain-containing protein [Leptobacterium flavescens]|uniref:Helix-turn-helix domain-containing protein n=1 Tax=Leptobacterium flavescens TaxID=472055 RepID=A0A6P0UHB5_9FLAO|nr:helix-turn-helix domain-containing protein [Leptobacterium flavescens]NER12711.1 helix-turn-helix domain-containing protein [Leptobacterium flavescens]